MRPPQLRYKLFPSIYLSHLRVELMQLSDFSFFRSLIHSTRLLCDFCSSDQSFVSGFLQIPPRDGHPCLQLYAYHCRSHSGLAPVRVCPCWANKISLPYKKTDLLILNYSRLFISCFNFDDFNIKRSAWRLNRNNII